PFDPAHPLTTPRGIDGSNPELERALADTVQFLQSNHTTRSAARWAGISLPGCPEERGCFNVIEATDSNGRLLGPPPPRNGPPPPGSPPRPGPEPEPAPRRPGPPPGPRERRPGGTPPYICGSTFIMAVHLTPDGPRARTILTSSESATPASPHHNDQTVLFSHKNWVTERFTEAEINADPHLQTTILHS